MNLMIMRLIIVYLSFRLIAFQSNWTQSTQAHGFAMLQEDQSGIICKLHLFTFCHFFNFFNMCYLVAYTIHIYKRDPVRHGPDVGSNQKRAQCIRLTSLWYDGILTHFGLMSNKNFT